MWKCNLGTLSQIGGETHLGNSQDTDACIITHNYQLAAKVKA